MSDERLKFSAFDHSFPRQTLAPTFGEVRKHRVGRREIVKRGPATLIGFVLHNHGYTERAIRFYDTANTANWGTEAEFAIMVEPGKTDHAEFAMQIPFFAGLAYEADGLDGILLFS